MWRAALSITVLLFMTVVLFLGALRGAQRPPFFPFSLDWDDGSKGPTDLTLPGGKEVPAGAGGRVVARDGHFYVGDERIRFWGTNVSFAGGTPAKSDAEAVARRMAKFGINIVRFHHLDHPSPRGILAGGRADTRTLDPEQLDRMDYFIGQLKSVGIYANLNLHVARTSTEADGVREATGLPQYDKYVSIFDPTLRRLMKEYTSDLLTHVNPYTGKAYTEEPAVAMVEITNENSLLAGWLGGGLANLPPYYVSELQGLWSDWLRARYSSTERLRRTWSEGVEPPGPEMLAAGDFVREPEQHWLYEQHNGAELRVRYLPATADAPASAELTVAGLSPERADWHIQAKQVGLAFEAGRTYTVRFRARSDPDRSLTVGVMQNHDPWKNLGLGRQVALSRSWTEHQVSFRATETEAQDARLSFGLGSAAGTVQLAAVSLKPGMEVLGAEESLEQGTIRPAEPAPAGTGARLTDYIRFLNDTELGFFTDMRTFIRDELGAKAPVTGTIGYGLPGVAVQAEMDFVDAHAYWQHPRFPGQPWSRTNWFVANRAMVDSPDESTISRLALGRAAGKPFTVTEYNHPAPNEFRAECVPLVAAYGALQDWDGIFLYTYHQATGNWDRRYIDGYFDIDTDPGKMVQMPVGAAIFLRGDVSPAHGQCVYRLSRDAACVAAATAGLDPTRGLRGAGHQPSFAFRVRLFLQFDRGAQAIARSGLPQPSPPPYESDTGELRWVGGTAGGLVTIDTPKTKGVIGRLGGRTVRLDGLSVQMPQTDSNFAAITLTAMDDRPLAESSRILITAVGRVENTGMGWNENHTSVSDKWGTAPTLAEGISADVVLASSLRRTRLSPLDSRGQPREGEEVPSPAGSLSFSVGPKYQTLWYLLSSEQ